MSKVFKIEYNGISKKLTGIVHVWSGGKECRARCLFDTGSMRSFISTEIVEQLKPRKTGETGSDRRNLYMVNFQFDEENIFSLIEVGEGTVLGENIDCIIGMDILSQCNFRIRPIDGNTVLTLSATLTDP